VGPGGLRPISAPEYVFHMERTFSHMLRPVSAKLVERKSGDVATVKALVANGPREAVRGLVRTVSVYTKNAWHTSQVLLLGLWASGIVVCQSWSAVGNPAARAQEGSGRDQDLIKICSTPPLVFDREDVGIRLQSRCPRGRIEPSPVTECPYIG
jgi:hypothetical protein